MIDDAADDTFDLIITKEISRFARTLTPSSLRGSFLAVAGVFFQNDNINTFDEDSELRAVHHVLHRSGRAAQASSRVKFGHQQAIKNNVVLGNSRIFGYRKRTAALSSTRSRRPWCGSCLSCTPAINTP